MTKGSLYVTVLWSNKVIIAGREIEKTKINGYN
jgi:hypothetical protein